MKKLLSILLTVCMILSVCAVSAFAEDTIKITVDGDVVDCAAYGQEPTAINGTTLVPLRSVFEALGATVYWDGETQSVVSTRGEDIIVLTLNSTSMIVNSEIKTLSVPAQSMNERTMVPVRAIAEAFGCEVIWDGETGTVIVLTEEMEMPAETPEGVISAVYDAMFDLDFEKALTYYLDPETAASNLEISSISNMWNDIGIEDPEYQNMFNSMLKKVLSLGYYTIDKVETDNNEAVVYATVYLPKMDDTDVDSALSDEMAEVLLLETIEELGYTEEEFGSITDMAEVEYVMDSYIENVVEYICDALYDVCKNKPLESVVENAKLQKINGRWLIVE